MAFITNPLSPENWIRKTSHTVPYCARPSAGSGVTSNAILNVISVVGVFDVWGNLGKCSLAE